MEGAASDEGDWAATLAAAGDGDYAGEEWCFDNTIASLAPWTQAPWRRAQVLAPRTSSVSALGHEPRGDVLQVPARGQRGARQSPSTADPREGGHGMMHGAAVGPAQHLLFAWPPGRCGEGEC